MGWIGNDDEWMREKEEEGELRRMRKVKARSGREKGGRERELEG